MDPVSMLVAVAIAVASGTGGFGIGRRRRARARQEEPICTCGHGLAFHDPQTNECSDTVDGDPAVYSELSGRVLSWSQEPCRCRQYVGPIPADRMLTAFSARYDPDNRAT